MLSGSRPSSPSLLLGVKRSRTRLHSPQSQPSISTGSDPASLMLISSPLLADWSNHGGGRGYDYRPSFHDLSFLLMLTCRTCRQSYPDVFPG